MALWHYVHPSTSYGTVCMILGLAVLVEHWLVTNERTDRQTCDDGKYRASLVACG